MRLHRISRGEIDRICPARHIHIAIGIYRDAVGAIVRRNETLAWGGGR